ncbi:MAG TPA: substrate-binding domain-containing protein [Burkholderiales bacterium]|nr:substrate-binding domain-containing protein [Burkholderiales bacterium]
MADTLSVFASNATRAVLDELEPELERASGARITISYDPAQIMLKRVAAGESADLAILNQAATDALAAAGKLLPESRRTLARCGVGVGVRAGAPKPDISTVDAFKRAMLEAKSIAHTTQGASGIHFTGLVERLGIADAVRAKAVNNPGGLIGELVIAGKAEIAIQQIPELMAVPGIEVVGPLPQELQSISVITAGIFATSQRSAAARAALEFLTTPAAARAFRAKGLEPA